MDMDPGIDDSVAIALADGLGLDIVGIGAVVGNSSVNDTTENALRVVSYLGMDVPVHRGATRPLVKEHRLNYFLPDGRMTGIVTPDKRPRNALPFHGRSGLGDTRLPPPRLKESHPSSPLRLIEAAKENRRRLDVVATGPLTDIAIALLLEPDLPRLIHRLVLMGGAFGLTGFGHGNITPSAEFNVFCDPEAAGLVMQKFDVVCVGLDVTADPASALREEDFPSFSESRRSELAASLASYPIRRWGYFNPHDPIALYYLQNPEAFKTVRADVTVELSGEREGQTVPSLGRGGTLEVVTHVDSAAFKRDLFKALGRT